MSEGEETKVNDVGDFEAREHGEGNGTPTSGGEREGKEPGRREKRQNPEGREKKGGSEAERLEDKIVCLESTRPRAKISRANRLTSLLPITAYSSLYIPPDRESESHGPTEGGGAPGSDARPCWVQLNSCV
ncbi:unnamed protein product [Pleuronectes platessa]|uniref:Uncharacterized protein n=1 Tax=Pleuronectes platessa TaxID=8262 RepID=A0A9N7VRF9_PLEPL|nr:unnamed protein product [Pleuronectes platessa]